MYAHAVFEFLNKSLITYVRGMKPFWAPTQTSLLASPISGLCGKYVLLLLTFFVSQISITDCRKGTWQYCTVFCFAWKAYMFFLRGFHNIFLLWRARFYPMILRFPCSRIIQRKWKATEKGSFCNANLKCIVFHGQLNLYTEWYKYIHWKPRQP